jgi:peptidoglycan-associated lipoprotein
MKDGMIFAIKPRQAGTSSRLTKAETAIISQLMRRHTMKTLFFSITAIILCCCIGIVLPGCAKKNVTKQDPVILDQQAEAAAVERERERVRLETEKARKEKEEAARRATEAEKELEKSLVAKKYPGIEGEVFESSLLKDVYFEFDRYDIRPEATPFLKENAALLMKYPKMKIQIEGHCDERGTSEYNLSLGERRANSAMNQLISLGISRDRISTISFGEERPFDSTHTEAAWSKNRRAHMVIVSR